MSVADLTADRLREVINYCSETGVFTWRFHHDRHKAKLGEAIGWLSPQGYRYLNILGKLHLSHRIAWLYVHGEWPAHHIDHKNGDRDDNRISNLRDVPQRVNNQNLRAANSSSQTGVLGVSLSRRKANPFCARIVINKKIIHLGGFKTAEQAHAAYIKAKRELHPGGLL